MARVARPRMSITSTSTLEQVQAAYEDNAGYAAANDAAMAHAFTTAARVLLLRIPAESGDRNSNIRFQMDLITKEIDRAEQWIAAGNGTNPMAAVLGPPPFTRVSTQFFRR